jgi:CheY-like chemotaxis protein
LNWLIAEDETDIRNLVSMMTTVWGHTPMTFESGQKVWDWMDKIEADEVKGPFPDFALMDIRMPGKRGYEISLRMRTVEPLKNIPIVLMTAFALGDEEIQRMKTEYSVDHIINKPLPDFDKLRTLLHDVISRKKTEVGG